MISFNKVGNNVVLVNQDGVTARLVAFNGSVEAVNNELVVITSWANPIMKALGLPNILYKFKPGDAKIENASAVGDASAVADQVAALFGMAAGAGSGGATDVSALNKESTQQVVRDSIGLKTDDPATSDNGIFGLIALTKRLLAKLPIMGQALMANSQPVTLASDQPPLKANAGNMIDFVTQPVMALNSVLYQGSVGDAKVLYLQYNNGAANGRLSAQFSLDNVNWSSNVPIQEITGNTQGLQMINTSTGNNQIFKIPVSGFYVRIYTSFVFAVSTTATLKGALIDMGYDLSTFAVSGSLTPVPSATIGGFNLTHKLIAAAGNNATSVKTSAGTIGTIILSNTSAAAKYFKLCATAAAPVPGTTVPIQVVMIPAGQTITINFELGMRIAAISYLLTTGFADSDTGALVAGDVLVNINYL